MWQASAFWIFSAKVLLFHKHQFHKSYLYLLPTKTVLLSIFRATISNTCCTILFCTRRFFFPGRNARQSTGAEESAGLDRSSGHSTNKNSAQVNGDNLLSDSSCNDSEQSNGISQNSALDEDSHNMILAMLPQLTQLFETKLLEMEKRICSRLSREVALSEQRLAKLILERTGASRSASIDEAELDLD